MSIQGLGLHTRLVFVIVSFFFCCFFKQKTAYENEYGLVGSEMCIRDSDYVVVPMTGGALTLETPEGTNLAPLTPGQSYTCLLYTSDAADATYSVDLGGRRILQKKKRDVHTSLRIHLRRLRSIIGMHVTSEKQERLNT